MKCWIKFFLVFVSLYPLAEFCKKQTDGFTIADIRPLSESAKSSYAVEPVSLTVRSCLAKRFHYLKSGGQSYAFVSEDGGTVLKFFKHSMRRAPTWVLSLPLPPSLKDKYEQKCKRHLAKLRREFDSYQLAFEELRDETGLLYVHLGPTDDLNQSIVIVDKLGIEHKLAADSVEFILQKKADLLYPHLENSLKSGHREGARRAIRSLLDLIVARCKKGIHDEDASIHRNLGFDGERPLFIDLGKFVKDPQRQDPAVYRQDLQKMTHRLNEWLKQHHPMLVPVLEEELQDR